MVLTLVKICFRALVWFTEEQFLDAIGRQQLPDHLLKELVDYLPNDRIPHLPCNRNRDMSFLEFNNLSWPAKRGDLTVIRRMLNNGGAYCHEDALRQAVIHGHLEAARLILTDLAFIHRQLCDFDNANTPHLWWNAKRYLAQCHSDDELRALMEAELHLPKIRGSLTEVVCNSEKSLESLLSMTEDLNVKWSMLKHNIKVISDRCCGSVQLQAVEENRPDIVSWLVQQKIAVSWALTNAVTSQKVEITRLLLPHVTLNCPASYVITDPALLELLLDWLPNEKECSLLVDAVATGGDVRLMDRVLSLGLRSPRAMEIAIQTGNMEMLELLLSTQQLDDPPAVTERVGRAKRARRRESPEFPWIVHLNTIPEPHEVDDPAIEQDRPPEYHDDLRVLVQHGGENRSVFPFPLQPLPAPFPAQSAICSPSKFLLFTVLSANMWDPCVLACLYGQAEIVNRLADRLSPHCLLAAVHGLPTLSCHPAQAHSLILSPPPVIDYQAMTGYYQVISRLAEAGVSVGQLCYSPGIPAATTFRLALVAASKGHLALANWLLSGGPVPTCNCGSLLSVVLPDRVEEEVNQDDVVFSWALGQAGNLDAFEWLIHLLNLCYPLDGGGNRSSKVNHLRRRVRVCNSALSLIAGSYCHGFRLQSMKLLIDNGADVVSTVLEAITREGALEEFRWLAEQAIQQGCEVNWNAVAKEAIHDGALDILALISNRYDNQMDLIELAIRKADIKSIHWLLPSLPGFPHLLDFHEMVNFAIESEQLEIAAFIKSKEYTE